MMKLVHSLLTATTLLCADSVNARTESNSLVAAFSTFGARHLAAGDCISGSKEYNACVARKDKKKVKQLKSKCKKFRKKRSAKKLAKCLAKHYPCKKNDKECMKIATKAFKTGKIARTLQKNDAKTNLAASKGKGRMMMIVIIVIVLVVLMLVVGICCYMKRVKDNKTTRVNDPEGEKTALASPKSEAEAAVKADEQL